MTGPDPSDSSGAPGTQRERAWFALRVFVSTILLVVLVRLVDWGRLVELVRAADLRFLAAALAVILTSTLFAVARWTLLLASRSVAQSWSRSYIYYLIGIFYNAVLPDALWGRLLHGLDVAVVGYFLAVMIGLRLLPHLSSAPGEGRGLVALARRLLGELSRDRLPTLLGLLLLSTAYQAAGTLAGWLVARGLGLPIPFELLLVINPAVHLAAAMPVSMGGLGVREGVTVFMLGMVGIRASDAVALAFLIPAHWLVVAMIGGALQAGGAGGPKTGSR